MSNPSIDIYVFLKGDGSFMRVIVIDDEHLALLQLKKLLENIADSIEVIGLYQDAKSAYEAVRTHSPEVVFLDIHMPGVNGLELAANIQEIDTNIEIVFVTGYDRYALDAFELFAFDYIMKPLQPTRLKRTVERLHQRIISNNQNIHMPVTDVVKKIKFLCFNSMKFQLPGSKPEAIKWRTAKAQELFVYMFHHRSTTLDREMLIELLWPDFDISRGSQQLYTTIYHIRQALKKAGIHNIHIESNKQIDSGYVLQSEGMVIDTVEWERELFELQTPTTENVQAHEQVFDKYLGDYLGEYGYIWAEGERERLRRLWLNHGMQLSRYYQAVEEEHKAILIQQRIQQMYPEEEESYFELMKIYAAQNYVSAVEEQYEQLQKVLLQELDISPSSKIKKWYEDWKRAPIS